MEGRIVIAVTLAAACFTLVSLSILTGDTFDMDALQRLLELTGSFKPE